MNLQCINILGQSFHNLLVIDYYKTTKSGAYWKCKCDCGKETIVLGSRLRNGSTKSCGCLRKMGHESAKFIDITGIRFGKLVVIQRVKNNKHGFAMWQCKCDCGKETIVPGTTLRLKKTISCGCYVRSIHINPPYKTIYNILVSAAKRTHRECTLTFDDYLEFVKIKNCHYCGKVIEWTPYRTRTRKSYMGYSLDRKNNDIGYTKDNCVVCCRVCNHIKGKMLTYNEMIKIGHLIGEIQKTRELFPPGS